MKRKNRVLKVVKNIIARLYVSREAYRESRYEIRNSNLNMLSAASLIASAIYLILFTMSFIPMGLRMEGQRFIYLAVSSHSLLFFVVSITLLPTHRKYITLSLYLFLFMLYSHGLVDGIIVNRTTHTAVFFVLQIVCPSLIIDKTVRMLFYNAAWTFSYIGLSILYKSPELAKIGNLDAACFFVVGSMMNMYLSHLRTKEFILNQVIRTERDSDTLTGLLNKGSLTREIKKNLAKNSANGVLLFLDVDDFKVINDTYGHDVGDRVLQSIARILRETFRQTDVIGRFGGDEFVIFMTDTNDISIAESRAQKALKNMRTCLKEPLLPLSVHGSFGIASCSANGENYNNLFKKADLALYASKNSGKNRISVHRENQ